MRLGIVSHCDLLSVFLRPGEGIARELTWDIDGVVDVVNKFR